MAAPDPRELEMLRAYGAPAEVIAAAQARQQQDAYEVWADNVESVEIFLGLATQWRTVVVQPGGIAAAPMVLMVGLEYAALESVLRLRGVPPERHAAVFDDIQLMERAALEVMHANPGEGAQ